MQTKLGAKLNILIERTMELWNGSKETKENIKQEQNVKVSQPIAGQHQPSQADTLDTSQLLPSNRGLTSIPQQNNPDFNDMYQNTVNPLQGAASPQQNEPMAANDGGSMFGSW